MHVLPKLAVGPERRVPPRAAGIIMNMMGPDTIFAGAGEVRALCRAMDWGATAAGPVES